MRLTDAQWYQLKSLGYIAVHNEDVWATSKQGGGAGNEWKKYRGLLNKIFGQDFDVDRFTIPVSIEDHRETVRDLNNVKGGTCKLPLAWDSWK